LQASAVVTASVGTVISPVLSNIFLHYALDLWAHQWRRRHASGDVILVRYADDSVMGFQLSRGSRQHVSIGGISQ
jgi:retron-type reverse transcriptase